MYSSNHSKQHNPLHNSQVLPRHSQSHTNLGKIGFSKQSEHRTKTSSEISPTDNHQFSSLCQNYQSKIKNLQVGFQKSKLQFENTLKQMYKEKIILLNVIGHNDKMIEEFKKKITFNPQSTFKEVQSKFQIITSGLVRNQLCSDCVMKISKMETQGSKITEKGNFSKNEKIQLKGRVKLEYAKQYSWSYEPTGEIQAAFLRLKTDNQKLKMTIEEISSERDKKLMEKDEKIKELQKQIIQASSALSHQKMQNQPKLIMRQVEQTKQVQKIKEVPREKSQVLHKSVFGEMYDGLLGELNEKIMKAEAERLNSKYRGRFY